MPVISRWTGCTDIPKLTRHKASGRAVVRLNGRDHYLGKFGTAEAIRNYDDLIEVWLDNNRQPIEKTKAPELCSLIEKYWEFCQTYYVKNGKPTDEQACVKIALRELNEQFPNERIDQFGPLKLEKYQHHLISKNNSRNYINSQTSRIRRMFKWGVSREFVPVEVYQALMTLPGLRKGKSKARETSPVLPVEPDIFEVVIKQMDEQTADMLRLQLLTGMRPGEVRTMRPMDIDRSSDIWRYTPTTHKTEDHGKHRHILIGPQSQLILQKYLFREPDDFCFLRQDGKPILRWNYGRKVADACKRAFPAPETYSDEQKKEWHKRHHFSPNQLRHSAATLIRKEFGLEAAQVVLGHSTADVTQIYAERDEEKAADVMRKLG